MDEPRRLGGRYELGQVLGRGGMAEVYLAHDTRLGRTVAVKTLRADLARDPTFQARFRREAQSAASLNHPAIVAVYDTGEDYVDGISIPYIVMEYVEGSTLRELLHSGRKLLPERALEMCIGILQALEYSHRNGIVHRDIKPANIMLTRNGQVKVMDFGIARAMGDAGMTMTQTSAVIGTAQYLSPEQAKGETVDARSDLYSTGCLLYELLTVRPPFIGDSPVAVAYQHVREEAQPPSAFDPEISQDTDAIVMKALVKDPDYRYQSADEMRADIEAALDGRPVGATAAMGAAAYGYDDRPTTMLRPTDPATTMLPPARDGDGYDDDYGRPDRRQGGRHTSTILLVLAGILVLVGAVLIGRVMFNNEPPSDELRVPDVAGKELDAAQEQLEGLGFQVSTGDPQPCEEEAGTVCTTDPEPGTELADGGAVTMIPSDGPAAVEVPDVVGDSFEDAEAELDGLGLTVRQQSQEDADAEPGTVLAQDPEGGSEVEAESEVTLTVAAAPETDPVPDVVGQDFDTARSTLVAAGFQVTRQNQPDDSRPENEVISQDPGASAPHEPGGLVVLTVAVPSQTEEPEEPAEVPVPNVGGQTLEQATATLNGAGFTQLTVDGPNSPTAVVVVTMPVAGQSVAPNTPITLVTNEPGGQPGGPGDPGGDDNGGPEGDIGDIGIFGLGGSREQF
ncbi:Stk1 family PASTA domain-containing Ser/Thr kinase [Streptomyces sp. DSM 44915]|uniref:non-specific serine/threonine protein kinase n=1 Tax=Streptomyces chisholmiae TaxID=3075540 RepID=A0ABU2JQ71_9ACTN|nr:Stk1 family PASTA domain-containing Ser/Thr kinase [Streptomyces sp. DSM 44915]MDT0267135.1 Stk1 family PASTA domain-containing Ser/Thr kinase [Streptomyces sp. DSM 44915]